MQRTQVLVVFFLFAGEVLVFFALAFFLIKLVQVAWMPANDGFQRRFKSVPLLSKGISKAYPQICSGIYPRTRRSVRGHSCGSQPSNVARIHPTPNLDVSFGCQARRTHGEVLGIITLGQLQRASAFYPATFVCVETKTNRGPTCGRKRTGLLFLSVRDPFPVQIWSAFA